MKRAGILALAVLLCVATVWAGGNKEGAATTGETFFLSIGTGGTAGTYYPLGGAMAEIINAEKSGVNASAVSTGASVANIEMLLTGEIQMAFVQNDVSYYAYTGIEMFDGRKLDSLRGVGTLYGETIQIVTVADTGIKTFADLAGKRIAVGAAGSGTEVNARQILDAVGLTYDDINPQYLSFGEAANGLRDGTTDAAVVTAGIPTAAIRDIAAQRDVVVIEIPDDVAAMLMEAYPFYTRFTIPANTYPKQAGDVKTLAVKAMLVVDQSLSADIVYEVTKAIFTGTERLTLAHAQGKNITKASATEGMSLPLHPGAERFFNE